MIITISTQFSSHKWRSSLFTCLFLIMMSVVCAGQPSFWFTKQSQIDSLQIIFPGIEDVGNLVIGFIEFDTTLSDIHNLTPLSSVKKIWGDLYIRNNPRLKNLYGLHNVDTVQTLVHTKILNNDSLENLQGLGGLKSVGSFFFITGNERLLTLQGLENLEIVHTFRIEDNSSLFSLDGLSKLKEITRSLHIARNGLQNLNIPALKKAGRVSVFAEPYLTNITGLANVDSIGEYTSFNSGNLTIGFIDNPSLTSLEGLENVELAPGSSIWIENNASLQNLEFLATIKVDSIRDFWVIGNSSLSDIYYPKVKKTRQVIIRDNAALVSVELPDLNQVTFHVPSYSKIEITGNPNLTDISMPKLISVGWSLDYSLLIENNSSLETLGNWESLEVVEGRLDIVRNGSLKNLSGLENLKSVGDWFQIYENKSLESMCNFTQFDSIGSKLFIFRDSMLTSLKGLETLKYIGTYIDVEKDSLLEDINALTELDSLGWNIPIIDTFGFGGMYYFNCPSLKKVDFSISTTKLFSRNFIGIGFCNQMDSVSIPFIQDSEGFNISDNDNLKYLSFPSLKNIGATSKANCRILNNASLTSLDGISSINQLKHNEDSLVVRNNPLLTDCEAICRMLDRGIPANRFKLGGNDFPCNSIPEIEEHICDTLTATHSPVYPENTPFLLTMPNPTDGIFYISLPQNDTVFVIAIYDMAGNKVFMARQNEQAPVNISHLPTGMYFVSAIDRNGVSFGGKIMKK